MKQRFVLLYILLLLLAVLMTGGVLPNRILAQDSNLQGIADKKTYLNDMVVLLKKQWPANRTVNIVCHGHSVPAGYFMTPVVNTFNAYPFLLHAWLKDRFPFAVINVIVTAIGGENSEGGAARFDKDVLSHNPDIITIDYGLNDRGLGLERTRVALVSMLEKAKARGIKVILLTPTGDMAAHFDDPNDPLNQQAELIRALAGEYHVGLADSLAAFQGYVKNGGKLADIMSQGNHPNRNGHNLVVRELIGYFSE